MMPVQPMHLILGVAIVLIVISFWRAHKTPGFEFNAFDLIMSKGKVDKIAVAFMLVLVLSSWVIVDLQVHGKLTEGYFAIYTGAWITPLVAKVVFNKTEPVKIDELSKT